MQLLQSKQIASLSNSQEWVVLRRPLNQWLCLVWEAWEPIGTTDPAANLQIAMQLLKSACLTSLEFLTFSIQKKSGCKRPIIASSVKLLSQDHSNWSIETQWKTAKSAEKPCVRCAQTTGVSSERTQLNCSESVISAIRRWTTLSWSRITLMCLRLSRPRLRC